MTLSSELKHRLRLVVAGSVFTIGALGLPAPSISASTLSTSMPLTLRGIGPIKIGMTLAQAKKASGDKLLSEYTNDDKDYGYAYFRHGLKGNSFMLHQDRIVRIDIDSPSFQTDRGAHIGDTEARIKALYPEATVSEHNYDPLGHYIKVAPHNADDKDLLLLFETDGKRVTTFRAGQVREVGFLEHCF